jgi:hypothetical protein
MSDTRGPGRVALRAAPARAAEWVTEPTARGRPAATGPVRLWLVRS